MDVSLTLYHAPTTKRATAVNKYRRAPDERDRESVFRIVKNRKFLPKAPWTDSRRSEKRLANTIGRTLRALFRRELTL
jgi:hypothetical protein